METATTPTAEAPVRKARQPHSRTSARPDSRKDDGRVKATIVMDRKLHWLLSSIAGNQGMDGSELAALLIDRGLKERHAKLYLALEAFTPKVARKAKPDAPDADKESAIPAGDVNPPEATAA
jgi:hypothetical protein